MPSAAAAKLLHQGDQLFAQGQFRRAAQAFQKATLLVPDLADAYYKLGVALQRSGQLAMSESAFQQCIQRAGNASEAYLRLAEVYVSSGLLIKAEQACREACRLAPESADGYSRLGTTLRRMGRFRQAIAAFDRSLELDPNSAIAHHDRGTTLQLQGNLQAAVRSYQRAISALPDYLSAHTNLGSTFQQLGKPELAVTAFSTALSIEPHYLPARVGLVMSHLKLVYDDTEDLEKSRAAYASSLSGLAAFLDNSDAGEFLSATESVGMLQPFLLAYQGRVDRDLQATYGTIMKALLGARPTTEATTEIMAGRIRVGFVSGFFRDHSNWKIPIKGWVQNLDRSQFELFAYHTSGRTDEQTTAASQVFDCFVQGPLTLEQWCVAIGQDHLDALIFPEFGMDPMTLQLGCMRHAPVQVTSWGHPSTSGLADIDYFLSSDLMEPEDAQAHYTEKLVKLPNLSIYCTPPAESESHTTRSTLGLSQGKTVALCSQSLFKYLPEFDRVFPEIARGAQDVIFLFVALPQDNVTKAFQRRLRRSFEAHQVDYDGRCHFLPRMSPADYSALMSVPDLFLDSLGWSGCNSTLEALAQDIPVVTLPGATMRSRHSSAMLQVMGMDELIADSVDQYIEMAVQVASNSILRDKLRQKIRSSKHKLYGDLAPVRALETFLISAVSQVTEESGHAARLSLVKARAHLKEGQPDGARSCADQAAKDCSRHPHLGYEAGRIWQSLEDYDLAADAFRSALKQLNPNYREVVTDAGLPMPNPTVPPVPESEIEISGIAYPAIAPVSDDLPRPFWSVAIPACNRKQYLLECLASVLAIWPGPEHMEILVIDNGSQPDLAGLVDAIGGGIARYLRHPETIPLQDNWNSAVGATRGHWVHLLHDDDYVLPGFYQTLRAGITHCDRPLGAAFCGYQNINEFGEVTVARQPFGPQRGIATDWLEVIGVGNVLNPPSMVISRAAYEKVGGYSNEILYTTDWELYKRVATFFDWWSEPDCLVHYRQHPLNITHAQNSAGAQGYSIRRSIEMSASYLPRGRSEAITQKARHNYFAWCVDHIRIPLRAGNNDGAMQLMLEALRIDHADDLVVTLFQAIDTEDGQGLKEQIYHAIHEDLALASANELFQSLRAPEAGAARKQLVQSLLTRFPRSAITTGADTL